MIRCLLRRHLDGSTINIHHFYIRIYYRAPEKLAVGAGTYTTLIVITSSGLIPNKLLYQQQETFFYVSKENKKEKK